MGGAPGTDSESSRPQLERKQGADEEATGRSEDWVESPGSDDEDGATDTSSAAASGGTVQVPRKFRDAQEGREQVMVWADDKSTVRRARHELDERFDEEVRKFDARAALLAVGLAHLDEVEAKLGEYGYGKQIE